MVKLWELNMAGVPLCSLFGCVVLVECGSLAVYLVRVRQNISNVSSHIKMVWSSPEWGDETTKAITIFRMSCGFDSTLWRILTTQGTYTHTCWEVLLQLLALFPKTLFSKINDLCSSYSCSCSFLYRSKSLLLPLQHQYLTSIRIMLAPTIACGCFLLLGPAIGWKSWSSVAAERLCWCRPLLVPCTPTHPCMEPCLCPRSSKMLSSSSNGTRWLQLFAKQHVTRWLQQHDAVQPCMQVTVRMSSWSPSKACIGVSDLRGRHLLSEWVSQWASEPVSQWASERVSQWASEWGCT